MREVIPKASAFALSVLVTVILASVVQTQVNLAAIVDLGARVAGSMRAMVTLEDVARFGPVMTAIVAAAFLLAFLAAHAVTIRLSSSWRGFVFAVAGCVGLWTAFFVMGFFTPMPALVAATRGAAGLAAVRDGAGWRVGLRAPDAS